MKRSRHAAIIVSLSIMVLSPARTWAEASDSYSDVLDGLREEIIDGLPEIDASLRKGIEQAGDSAARIDAVNRIPQLGELLRSDALDAKLARFVVLHEATPSELMAYVGMGKEHRERIDALLGDDQLMLQIAIADGARPVQGRDSGPARYGRVMEIYNAVREASPKAKEGVLHRLALAVALEFSESADEEGTVDPVERYLHYERAHEAGELDPYFDRFSIWELRFVVSAPESDEALTWGREMLRNFRPDHILTENVGGRYTNLVNTDVQYGSIRVKHDRPELMGVQNILMNGGICGRRAFFARYICRAFGIPATARPSTGHGASARWTPDGWIVVLGPRWGSGRTTTRYRNDLDFLATTQARARGDKFLRVKRAQWIGDVMGEERNFEEAGEGKPFWNGVALATRRRIIEESDAMTLDPLGAELGEANGISVASKLAASSVSIEDRMTTRDENGSITIPAVGCVWEEGEAGEVIPMKSFGGGAQVFLPRFFHQKPILVRGGSWRHEAALCASATRHWRGRRPRKSGDLRGLRLVVVPDEEVPAKEMSLDLGEGVSMEFVHIPPGTFIMGGTLNEKDGDILADTPKHEVTLSKGFYFGKYEVTNAQYRRIMDPDNDKPLEDPNHPVDGVKPYNGILIGEYLSAATGLEARLPTEAEWEYAARAGTDTIYSFGDDPAQLGDHAWFKDNAGGKAHPVGLKKPNPWGLHDMYGNVAEFVRDEHLDDYYANSPKVDPTGPLLGIHSSMKVTVTVAETGRYDLVAKVVTANPDQFLKVEVNGAVSELNMPLTLGAWGESGPVTVVLKKGENVLHFWRDGASQYGMAVKSFTLAPHSGE